MLDLLLKLAWLERKPAMALLLGLLFPTAGMIFAVLLFPAAPSFPAIFLTTLAAAPVLIRLLEHEKLDIRAERFLKRNIHVTEAYLWLFIGMAIAFGGWFAVLPPGIAGWLFGEQLHHVFGATGAFTFRTELFVPIIVNNLGLLLFFFLLALFYGSGSVLLLSWNASILGIMWGSGLRALLVGVPEAFARQTVFILPYMLPEITAYFLAAIAGGIVAVHLHTQRKILPIAMRDSMVLLGISVAVLIVAAVVETVMLGAVA